jgi:hypothetical protein
VVGRRVCTSRLTDTDQINFVAAKYAIDTKPKANVDVCKIPSKEKYTVSWSRRAEGRTLVPHIAVVGAVVEKRHNVSLCHVKGVLGTDSHTIIVDQPSKRPIFIGSSVIQQVRIGKL